MAAAPVFSAILLIDKARLPRLGPYPKTYYLSAAAFKGGLHSSLAVWQVRRGSHSSTIMSAIMKASAITRVAALSTSAALVAAMPSTRGYFSRVLGIGAPGGVWRALFILLAVLNFKNVPFVWHVSFVYRGSSLVAKI